MPMIGFLPIPAGEDPLAGFPSDGLVALYKCDELDGAVLKDAVGTLPDINLASGVALDCTTNAQYVSDGTGLATAMNTQPAALSFGYSIKTPATTGGTGTVYLQGSATGTDTHFKIYFTEAAYGSTIRRWRPRFSIKTSLDGGGVTARDLSFPTYASSGIGLAGATGYDIVGTVTTDTASGVVMTCSIRQHGGEWFTVTISTASVGTHVFASTGAFQLLANNAGSAWTGMISNAFIALGALDMDLLKNLISRPTPTYIESALSGVTARYWSFSPGAGTKAWERTTSALVDITGTQTFVGAQSWGPQYALRQGMPYYGKAGLRLGGEASFVPQSGRSVCTGLDAPLLASADGWSMVATLRVGDNAPAASMVLCGFHGPDATGVVSTDQAALAGVNITVDTSRVIKARIKKLGGSGDDTGSSTSIDIGDGGNYVTNGLLTTYVISCDSTGALTVRKVAIGDTDVTTVTHAASADLKYLKMRANAAGFGWASFDADCIVGFLAAYNRPLTDAEVMQCHKMSVARMRGQDIYVNGDTGLLGNGTEVAPYSIMHDAWRTLQPGQTVRVTGGSYARKTNLGGVSSQATPASSDRITIIGTGDPELTSTGTSPASYPLELVSGHWTWSGFVFDADDSGGNISGGAPPPGYANAVNASEDVDYVSFSGCAFNNSAKSNESNGTGLACRAKTCIITDCTGADNEEHTVYLRRWVGETEDGSVTIGGLTCTVPAGGEDGLKITAEGAGGRLWRGSIRNLTVTGGKNQLNLKGFVGDVANVLLVDQESEQELVAACYLGADPAYTGETLDSDYRFEGRVTNMTIVGANARAVWVKGSNTTAALYNVLTEGTAGVDLDVDEDSTCTTSHCAGDAATGEWPDENGNIPGATITFTDAGGGDYTLDEASDGYGDGINLTGIIEEAETDLAGDPRPSSGAWNIGAF